MTIFTNIKKIKNAVKIYCSLLVNALATVNLR